jgi:hypothetical protein
MENFELIFKFISLDVKKIKAENEFNNAVKNLADVILDRAEFACEQLRILKKISPGLSNDSIFKLKNEQYAAALNMAHVITDAYVRKYHSKSEGEEENDC